MSIPVTLGGKRVFVVDDEANIADTLSLILRGVGFTVRTFYDGLTALEHAQRRREPPFGALDQHGDEAVLAVRCLGQALEVRDDGRGLPLLNLVV